MQGEGQAGASEIKSASWVNKQSVKNSELVKALRQELDAGEAEAIALALETRAELLLDGRKTRPGYCKAPRFGLHGFDRRTR